MYFYIAVIIKGRFYFITSQSEGKVTWEQDAEPLCFRHPKEAARISLQMLRHGHFSVVIQSFVPIIAQPSQGKI